MVARALATSRALPWVAVFLCAASCSRAEEGAELTAGYDLATATASFELPKSLREISSLAAVGPDLLACVQDEKGAIYYFDVSLGDITRRAKFGKKGDYEGLAYDGEAFFVLRSDGLVLRVEPEEGALADDDVPGDDRLRVVERAELDTEQRDLEGIAFDPLTGALIVAPKERPDGKHARHLRPLYRVSRSTLERDAEPLTVLDLERVRIAAERAGASRKQLRERLRVRFAEIAVHPTTGDLWLLSGVDRLVLVAARTGEIRGVHFFGKREQPQPEALAFLPDGRLAIASEGRDGPAVLRVYSEREVLR